MPIHRPSRSWAIGSGFEERNVLGHILVAIGAGLFFWVADSIFDFYVFHEHPLVKELTGPHPRESLFRWVTGAFTAVFVFQYLRIRQARYRLDAYRASVEHAGDAVLWKDAEGNLVYVNEAACRRLGYTRNELLHMGLLDIDPSATPDGLAQAWETIRRTKQLRIETQHRTKSGQLIPVEVITNYVCLDGNEYHFSVVRDMSVLRSAERALKRSQESLALAQRIARIGSFDWDATNGSMELSDEMVRLLGVTPGTELSLDQINAYIHPDDQKRVRDRLSEDFALKRNHVSEHRMVQPNGAELWVHCIGEFAFDAKGDIVRMIGTVSDITERKSWETALAQSEERARLLLDSAGEGIMGINREGNITFINRAALDILGYRDAAAVLGKNPHPLMHHTRRDGSPYPTAECRGLLTVGSTETVLVDDEVFWRADGTSFDAEYRMHPILRGNEVDGAVSSFSDITKRKQSERDLKEYAAKLKAANELKDLFTDILGHDLLNLLTAAQTSGELLLWLEADARKIGLIETNLTSVARMVEICQNIATYARISGAERIEFSSLDLNVVLRETIDGFMQALADRQIELRFAPSGGSCVAAASRLISDVFGNLISNAIKYGPKGASIDVEVVECDRHWVVSVADQGRGISAEDRERVFNRFERVEKVGIKGSGLGLAIAKRIVDLHGGKIWIEDRPGGGSVFRVRLPKQDARPHDERERNTLTAVN